MEFLIWMAIGIALMAVELVVPGGILGLIGYCAFLWGVFVALGTAGSAEMARQMGAALTEKGNIKVNEKMESTIPGLFAAGDCTGGLLQVAKAVYDGAQAGLSANQYVRNRQKK